MAELSGFGPPRDLATPTGGLANRCLTRLGLQLQRWRKRRILKSHTALRPLLAVFKTAPLPLGLLFQMAEGRNLEILHGVSPATGGVRSRFLAFRITLPKMVDVSGARTRRSTISGRTQFYHKLCLITPIENGGTGEIRTHTVLPLKQVTLPVGLQFR